MVDSQRGIAALDERIPFLLAQLGSHVGDNFQHRLAPIGVEPRTYAVLAALAALTMDNATPAFGATRHSPERDGRAVDNLSARDWPSGYPIPTTVAQSR
jgi:hypothetical protein